ncbi:hypothetical protein SMICM17S_07868 [Streptomyces microflavus]
MRGGDSRHHQPTALVQLGHRLHPRPPHQLHVLQPLQHLLCRRQGAAQQPGQSRHWAAAPGIHAAAALPYPPVLPRLQHQQQQRQPVRRRTPACTRTEQPGRSGRAVPVRPARGHHGLHQRQERRELLLHQVQRVPRHALSRPHGLHTAQQPVVLLEFAFRRLHRDQTGLLQGRDDRRSGAGLGQTDPPAQLRRTDLHLTRLRRCPRRQHHHRQTYRIRHTSQTIGVQQRTDRTLQPRTGAPAQGQRVSGLALRCGPGLGGKRPEARAHTALRRPKPGSRTPERSLVDRVVDDLPDVVVQQGGRRRARAHRAPPLYRVTDPYKYVPTTDEKRVVKGVKADEATGDPVTRDDPANQTSSKRAGVGFS